jgi:SAM-dependent methyltransferase
VLAEPALRPAEVIYLSSPTDFQMADEWYEFARPDHFWFQWRFAALQALLGDDWAGPTLEIGCGNGAARQQFERAYNTAVDGCDVNPAALRRAAPGRGRLYFYNIHERRGAWRAHYRTALLLDTLEHIRDPVEFLRSTAYHLQPGGALLLNVPAWPWLYSRYDRAQGHIKRYTRGMLNHELAAAGLRLVRAGYWGLSLVPVLLLRKGILSLTPPARVVQVGFEPGTPWIRRAFDRLRQVECALRPLWPLGISLVALARKDAS